MNEILSKAKDFEYWIGRLFTFLSLSVVMFLWIYVKDQGHVSITVAQIVFYFSLISFFHYLFSYVLTDTMTKRLFESPEKIMLSPRPVIFQLVKLELLPRIYEGIIPFVLLSTLAVFLGWVNLHALVLFLGLFILANVGYFFSCLFMGLLFRFLNLTANIENALSFTLRFIGVTWNGSFLPFLLLSDKWQAVMMKTPYVISGLPFQVLIGKVGWEWVAWAVGYTVVVFAAGMFILNIYKRGSRL